MKSFEAAISLLNALLGEEDMQNLPDGSNSTRYRHIDALRRAGLIFRAGPDRYLPQPVFLQQMQRFDHVDILVKTLRPAIRALSTSLKSTAHFGILEGDMVTYLVKESVSSDAVHTRENQQLEAYCSAIGKILLSRQPEAYIEHYLSTGPFPALTPHTLTDPDVIRRELKSVAEQGYACDDAEVDERLFCLAVPARDALGRSVGAISVSSNDPEFIRGNRDQSLKHLDACVARVAKLLE